MEEGWEYDDMGAYEFDDINGNEQEVPLFDMGAEANPLYL